MKGKETTRLEIEVTMECERIVTSLVYSVTVEQHSKILV